MRGKVGNPLPSKETKARRALSIVPSAITATPSARGCRRRAQGDGVRVRQNHELLLGIDAARIRRGGARGFHQQRHRAEFVQREKACVWWPCLNAKRCFNLQKIAQIVHAECPGRIKSEHAQKVCQLLATFEQR